MNIFPFHNVENLSSVFQESEIIPFDQFSSQTFSILSSLYRSHDTYGENEILDENLLTDIENNLPQSIMMEMLFVIQIFTQNFLFCPVISIVFIVILINFIRII